VKRQRGFTLLEILIATSIMSLGMVAALELFTGSMRLAGEASRQSHAVVLARALIDEELWRYVLEENVRSGNDGAYQWTVETRPIDRELVGLEEAPSDRFRRPGEEFELWLIAAEVRWEGAGGGKSFLLETARLAEARF